MRIRDWALIILAARAAAAGIVLEPLAEREFGTIHYDMDFPFPSESFTDGGSTFSDAYGRSLLSFPVDVMLAGLRMEIGDPDGEGTSWFASAKTSLSQPRRSMEDKDWVELRGSSGLTSATAFMLFSDTDSRTRLEWWSGELGTEYAGFRYRGRRIRVGWRVGADFYAADIYGLRGWQGNKLSGTPGVDYVEFDTLQGVKVLTYRALYLAPGATASTHWLRGRHADLDLRAALSPATFARDEDTHLLRDKRSEAWAVGLDGSLEADLVWHVGARISLKLGACVGYTRTWGKMTQEFYGDSPEAAEGNRQLQSLGDIDNKLGRFTYALRVSTPIALTGWEGTIAPEKESLP